MSYYYVYTLSPWPYGYLIKAKNESEAILDSLGHLLGGKEYELDYEIEVEEVPLPSYKGSTYIKDSLDAGKIIMWSKRGVSYLGTR